MIFVINIHLLKRYRKLSIQIFIYIYYVCRTYNLNNAYVVCKISVSPPCADKTDFYIFIFYLWLYIFKIENKSQINNNLINTIQAFKPYKLTTLRCCLQTRASDQVLGIASNAS